MRSPVVLPAAHRIARRWKNGGGITHDIVLFPPGSDLDDFGWRLSIAELAQDGPFSHFSGVDRHLAVLAGQLLLESSDGSVEPATPLGEPISFAGDQPIYGRVVSGPVRDLNLMVRRSAFRGRLRRSAWIDEITVAETTVLVALSEAMIAIDDVPHQLALLDAVQIGQNSRVRSDSTLIAAEIFSAS